jgi:hypothetical protein
MSQAWAHYIAIFALKIHPPNREAAMFTRSYYILVFTVIIILGLDLALSVPGLKAASSHVFQIHRNYPGVTDSPNICPAAAKIWCQNAGGLAE